MSQSYHSRENVGGTINRLMVVVGQEEAKVGDDGRIVETVEEVVGKIQNLEMGQREEGLLGEILDLIVTKVEMREMSQVRQYQRVQMRQPVPGQRKNFQVLQVLEYSVGKPARGQVIVGQIQENKR